MKKLLAIILLFIFIFQSNALLSYAATNIHLSRYSDEALTNKDVFEMLKSGLSAEIIVAKIKSSVCAFDTSTKALQEMKSSGVPEQIILAMVEVSAPKEKSVAVNLPDNTPIELELAYDLTSATAKKNDKITFRAVRAVEINGVTLIAAGALANGKIVEAKKARRWGREGKLAFSVEEVFAVDEKAIPLKAENKIEGEGNKGEVATKTVVSAALLIPFPILAPLALLNGFKRGENAVLPAGTRFTVYVNGNALITTR